MIGSYIKHSPYLFHINKQPQFYVTLKLYRPGVGKTTVMREISRVLSDELHKRVVSLALSFLFVLFLNFFKHLLMPKFILLP